MAYQSGFLPLYDGFIRYNTSSFAVSHSIGALDVRDKLFHNLEWLYGTHSQIRVNWTTINGIKVGTEAAPLTAGSSSLLYSDGPFPLSLSDDGTPLPLYVRVEAGINNKVGDVVTGSLVVHLRQKDLINNVFFESEVGSVEITGETDSRAVYEFTTVSSSLSTTSSILEIQGRDNQGYHPLAIRTTRSLNETDEQAHIMLCWLDFYGVPAATFGTDGFSVYSVFAQEVIPKIDD